MYVYILYHTKLLVWEHDEKRQVGRQSVDGRMLQEIPDMNIRELGLKYFTSTSLRCSVQFVTLWIRISSLRHLYPLLAASCMILLQPSLFLSHLVRS